MSKVQFIDVKPFVSCCKDLEVIFHVPSTIKPSTRHYVALKEVGEEQGEFSWVWSGRTEPLEPENNGITVKWRKGKVVFTSRVLPKLSDGREYYFIYCNEDGTTLGQSGPFHFCTDSDEFSSIDLQSTPSDNMVMISLHKKAPSVCGSETSLHSNSSLSFEVVSEEDYTDTTKEFPPPENKDIEEPSYYNAGSVTSTVVPAKLNVTQLSAKGSDDDQARGDDLLSASSRNVPGENEHQDVPVGSNNYDKETIESLKLQISLLADEVSRKDHVIEEQRAEITALKDQSVLTSTVMINSPKHDKEKQILTRRIHEETKKSSKLEQLLRSKETRIMFLENEVTRLRDESLHEKVDQLAAEKFILEEQLQEKSLAIDKLQIENRKQQDQIQYLQTELHNKPEQLLNSQISTSCKTPSTTLLTQDEKSDLAIPVSANKRSHLYVTLFKQEPFVCCICNEILPAHTQEFARLNHIQQCKGRV